MINSATTSAPAPGSSVVAQRTDNASLLRRLEFEQLLSEVSTCFINLSAEEIDRHINQALGQVGSFLGFNLGAISKFSGQGSGCEVTHIWTAAGLPPIPPGFTELDFPWASGSVAQGNEVHLTSLDVLPLEAQRDRQTYERFGLRSVYNWPLQVGGTVVGILSFASVAKAHGFPTDFEQGLKLLAQVMASSLARARDDRALRESEERFRNIAVNLPGVVYQFYARDNGERGLYYVAGHVKDVCGLDLEPLGTFFERFAACVAPEDRQPFLDSIDEAARAVRAWEHEVKFIKPDGEEIYIRGFSQPQRRAKEVVFSGMFRDVTEKKRLELNLAEREARFRALTESALVGIYILQDGKYIYINPSMARVFGYTVAEMTGMTPRQIVQPEDHAIIGENIRRRIAGEVKTMRYEVRGRHKDGSPRHVEVYDTGLEINGKPALLGTLLDITARKRAEDALRKNEARLTSAIDAAELGFYEEEGPAGDRRTFMDSRVGHILGIPNDIYVGVREYWLEHLHPEDRQLVLETANIFEKGERERATIEYRFRHPQRGVIWLRHIVHALARNEAGEVIRLIGVFQDITDRKRAEEALKESEGRFRRVVEHIQDALMVDDIEGRVVFANARFLELFGLRREELATLTLEDYVAPEFRAELRERHERRVRGEKELANFEYLGMRRDGRRLWLEVAVVPVTDEHGRITGTQSAIRDIDVRKRAERELKQKEERFRQVAEIAEEFIWEVDVDGLYTYASPSVTKILEYAPEELVGKKHFFDLFEPSVREALKATAFQAFAGHQTFRNFRNPNVTRSGKIVHLESSGLPLLDPQGKLLGYRGADVDVTERLKAQQVLREAEEAARRTAERLSLAQRAGRVGVFDWDLITNHTVWTPELEEIFGLRQNEFENHYEGWAKRVHPEDLPGLEKMFATWFASDRDEAEWEYRFLRRGEERWIAARGRVFRDKNTGRPLRLIGTNLDITERKLAEERARESEARLASAVEIAGLGFFEMGTDPEKIFVDDYLRSLLGLTPQDKHRVREFWAEHIHPEDQERMHELNRRVVQGELKEVSVEYRYQHPQRGTLWFSHASRVEREDPTGKVIRRLGVIRDVTAQRQAELESQQLRGNLAHLTRVNTLGALSGSLAHELNQPLGIILSNAQAGQDMLLQQPADLQELQAVLADIIAADRRAGEVIQRLRGLFRQGEASLKPLSLNELIEEVLRLINSDLIGRGVSAVRDLAADLPPVAGDRVQLEQVLINLIMNASDAMSANAPGTRRLHLQTKRVDGMVRAAVRDEGVGLPRDVERLFQPFYTTKTQGLGLGLAICRSIINAHHGRLWGEPHPERGAVFQFELPVTGATTSL